MRRRLIPMLLALACAAPAFAQGAGAGGGTSAAWAPTRPVRIIVPITGSTNDTVARLIQPQLQEALGQPVVVENKPGAGGNIGADYVAKAPPDGHTLLVGYNGPIAINRTLFRKMPFDPQKDLAPVSLIVTSPQYLVVHPEVKAKTPAEFVALARERQGALSYASVAVGSASHLTMEMLKSAARVDIAHVPYKGAAPALVDLVAGNVQSAFLVPGNVQQFVKEGRLRVIATTGEKRFASMPEVPTMVESGYPDFVATSWVGILAPAGTPRAAIERLNREIVRIARSPEISAKLRDLEFDVVATSPEDFAAWIGKEIPRWGAVIRSTGATAD